MRLGCYHVRHRGGARGCQRLRWFSRRGTIACILRQTGGSQASRRGTLDPVALWSSSLSARATVDSSEQHKRQTVRLPPADVECALKVGASRMMRLVLSPDPRHTRTLTRVWLPISPNTLKKSVCHGVPCTESGYDFSFCVFYGRLWRGDRSQCVLAMK